MFTVSLIKRAWHGFGDDGLSPLIRNLLFILATGHGIIGSVALVRPDLFESGAYSWAIEILPLPFWAIMFLVSAAIMFYAACRRNSTMARLGFVLYAGSQWVFAASIVHRTFTHDNSGTIAGSIQGRTGPAIVLAALLRPIKGAAPPSCIEIEIEYDLKVEVEVVEADPPVNFDVS